MKEIKFKSRTLLFLQNSFAMNGEKSFRFCWRQADSFYFFFFFLKFPASLGRWVLWRRGSTRDYFLWSKGRWSLFCTRRKHILNPFRLGLSKLAVRAATSVILSLLGPLLRKDHNSIHFLHSPSGTIHKVTSCYTRATSDECDSYRKM